MRNLQHSCGVCVDRRMERASVIHIQTCVIEGKSLSDGRALLYEVGKGTPTTRPHRPLYDVGVRQTMGAFFSVAFLPVEESGC